MLYYDRTDISEGTDLIKSNKSKELANMKNLIYSKTLYLKIVGIDKKYCLNCQSQSSFLFFWF